MKKIYRSGPHYNNFDTYRNGVADCANYFQACPSCRSYMRRYSRFVKKALDLLLTHDFGCPSSTNLLIADDNGSPQVPWWGNVTLTSFAYTRAREAYSYCRHSEAVIKAAERFGCSTNVSFSTPWTAEFDALYPNTHLMETDEFLIVWERLRKVLDWVERTLFTADIAENLFSGHGSGLIFEGLIDRVRLTSVILRGDNDRTYGNMQSTLLMWERAQPKLLAFRDHLRGFIEGLISCRTNHHGWPYALQVQHSHVTSMRSLYYTRDELMTALATARQAEAAAAGLFIPIFEGAEQDAEVIDLTA